ncbi:MAG: cardiolipin synthase [Ruthenibacterium sp.]
MRKIFGSVTFRIIVLVLMVLLQLGVLVTMFLVFEKYFVWFYAFCIILAIIAVLYIVRQDSNPAYKIAWLIPIMLLPILGGLLYLMFGRYRITRREQRRSHEIAGRYKEALCAVPDAAAALYAENPVAAQQTRYLDAYADAPVFAGTQAEYLPLGEAMFDALLTELEQAQHFIFLEYFIIRAGKMWDSVLEVLTRKAAAGVDVRVMYDDMGCLFLLPADFPMLMEARGIQCCAFNRFTHIFNARFNNRDHRKICVIDGNVGFTGGINLSDEYINAVHPHGHWKDTAVLLRGQAVYSLTAMFLSIWDFLRCIDEDFAAFAPTKTYENAGYVQPFTDSPTDDEPVGETMYMNILNKAQRYVYIVTPYLIIDNEMITAMSIAAKSGVDVRIITPGVPDKKTVYFVTRSYYEVLLKAGIKIYEYTPGFVHAKSFVSDDTTAVVGTINLDYRSLYLHYECAAWMYGTPCVADIRDDFLATQAQCREVTLDSIQRLSLAQRGFLSILRIFAPLM